MPRAPRPLPNLLTAIALAALLGCGDEPTEAPAVAFVVIQHPATTTLAIGDTLRLKAVAADAQARPIDRATIDWTSLDPQVAAVDATGLVTALDGGDARIEAASGGQADTVTLTVISIPKGIVASAPGGRGGARLPGPPSRGR